MLKGQDWSWNTDMRFHKTSHTDRRHLWIVTSYQLVDLNLQCFSKSNRCASGYFLANMKIIYHLWIRSFSLFYFCFFTHFPNWWTHAKIVYSHLSVVTDVIFLIDFHDVKVPDLMLVLNKDLLIQVSELMCMTPYEKECSTFVSLWSHLITVEMTY